METSPVIHEWFYPQGPDTYEYLLPIGSFYADHSKLLPKWTQGFATLTPAQSKPRFAEYMASVTLPEISTFTNVVKTLTPFSIVVHKTDSWLLCKREDQFDKPSVHGNMLQLPAPYKNVEWPQFFDSDQFNPLKHFLKYFGNTRIDMPPTCGTRSPIEMQPVFEDVESFAWKNIQSWDGSYPVYNVGNGDVVLVDSNFEFGVWCHELCRDTNGAVQKLGSFQQFMEFVTNETGLAR